MKKILIILLLATYYFVGFSQIIIGRITDKGTQEGVIQATIQIKSTTNGTATDFDGNYKVKVNGREGILIISYVGYQTIEVPYSFPEGVDEITVDAFIEESGTLLNETVITASKFERKLGEETVSIDIISPKMIGNQNLSNASEVIGKSPGVTMIDGQANIRGGSGYSYGAGSRVLLLLDGLPIYQADAGRPLWTSIPLESIGQIEIIKGAASALYGSSAMNGIINVKTAFAKSKPETYISVFSSYFEEPAGEYYDENGELVDKKWWNFESITFDTTVVPLDEVHPFNAGLSFSHRRKMGENQNVDFVIGGEYFKEQRWRYGDFDHRGRISGNVRYRATDRMTFGMSYTARYTASGNFFLWNGIEADMYLPNSITGLPTKTKVVNVELSPYFNVFDEKGNTHRILTRYLHVDNINTNNQTNQSELAYLEYQYQRDFTDIGLTFSAGVVTSYLNSKAELFGGSTKHGVNVAIYTQADKKFFDKLTVAVGLRVETNVLSETKTETKPVARFGLNYQAAEATFLRASIGQGYRFPSIAEKFITTELGPKLAIQPNPDLVSETGMSLEVALKQGWKTSNSAFKGFLDVSFFYMAYKNMMEFNVYSDPAYLVAFKSSNVGNTFISGVETNVFAQGKLHGFPTNLIFGYTFIDPKFKIFDLTTRNGGVAEYNVLKYRYRHTLTATWDIDIHGFTFGTNMQYYSFMENLDEVFNDKNDIVGINVAAYREARRKDGREANQEPRTYKGDFIVNLRVGYHTKDNLVNFSFLVNNVGNRVYSLRPALVEAPRTFGARIDFSF